MHYYSHERQISGQIMVAFKMFSNKKRVWRADIFGRWDKPRIPDDWKTLTLSVTKSYVEHSWVILWSWLVILTWQTDKSSEEPPPVASVSNLHVTTSDYNDFAEDICDSRNATSSNSRPLEWECDVLTDCATEPQSYICIYSFFISNQFMNNQ